MMYQKSIWRNAPEFGAYIWYSELDGERWESRVVVEFRDRYLEYSDVKTINTDPSRSWISEKPWPAMLYAENEDFEQSVLTFQEFEIIWALAIATGQQGMTRQHL